MSLISIFKRKSKNIILKQDIEKYLVFPYECKHGLIYLNKTAVVPENTVLFLAGRGKLLDCLPAGEFMLGAVTLPKCSKKFKLYKLDKNGKAPSSFEAFAYFVNLRPVSNICFETYKKIRYKNALDGRFWVKLSFQCELKVMGNGEKFLNSLFTEFAYIKHGEPEQIASMWLSEKVTKFLQKHPHRRIEFKDRLNETIELLKPELQQFCLNVGLELISLSGSAILSKIKDEEQSEKNMKVDKNIENIQGVEEGCLQEETVSVEENSKWVGWEKLLK